MDGEVLALLEQINGKLDQQTEILNEHSKILDQHSEILNQHSEILNQHSEILNQHSEILNRHEGILSQHTQLLGEHTGILRALEHASEVQRAQMDQMNHTLARVEAEVKTIREDLTAVELVTSKNWNDIVKLKAIR
ncbi:hypothetical protein [Alkaliphilus crotonatoxidans]